VSAEREPALAQDALDAIFPHGLSPSLPGPPPATAYAARAERARLSAAMIMSVSMTSPKVLQKACCRSMTTSAVFFGSSAAKQCSRPRRAMTR
jgi:hypothetical protein